MNSLLQEISLLVEDFGSAPKLEEMPKIDIVASPKQFGYRSRAEFQERLTAAGYGQITTEITPGQQFYYAELEHQQYLHKNPHGYCPNHATGVKCGPPTLAQ